MTGYTVHTGSTIKFSTSWDRIFSDSKAGKDAASSKKSVGTPAKKGTGKATSKKSVTKKPAPASSTNAPKAVTQKKASKVGKKKVR